MSHREADPKSLLRRRRLRAATIAWGASAAVLALPKRWTRPIVERVETPLHAQGSIRTLGFSQPPESGTANSNPFIVTTTPSTSGLPAMVTGSAR